MTEREALREMRKIERQLMHLANANNGNGTALDAILAAAIALQDFRERTPQ
jgi:hypothetical protein